MKTTTPLAPALLLLLLPLLPIAAAFSSLSVPRPSSVTTTTTKNQIIDSSGAATTTPAAAVASSWRVVLDIGREPLSSMPFDWARSGCRMPLVIPCDFWSDQSVQPRSETVSFTGPNGAVTAPVQGGTWEWSNDKKDLSLTLSFPESFARRDVSIDAGTTIQLSGRVYTKTELDKLNEEFYKARDETWKIGGEVNDMTRRQGAPKKWNEEKQQWEKRYENESILSQVQKRISLMGAQAVQKQKANQRPNPNTLSSDRGWFPGIEDDAFVQKEGVITIPKGGGWRGDAVIGRWSAEPITDKPVSYYHS